MHQTGLKKASVLGLALSGTLLFTACGGDDNGGTMMMTSSLGTCSAASYHEIWVPRQMANDIKIVRGDSLALDTHTIDLMPTGLKNPHGVTFNADKTRAAVAMLGTPEARYADGGVVIVNVENYSVVSSIITRRKTHQAAFGPNNEIWGVNVTSAPMGMPGNGSISFVDIATATTSGELMIGGSTAVVRFNMDRSKAYITDQAVSGENSKVHVVNPTTKQLDGTAYATGKVTVTPVFTADYKTLFVTNGMSNSVDKIDVTAADRATAVTTFATGLEEAHAVALGIEHVVVTARMGGRIAIFKADGTLAKNLPVTVAMGNPIPDMVTMSPDCKVAYATERAEGKLLVIDMTTLEIKNTVDLGGGYTHGVAVVTRSNPDM